MRRLIILLLVILIGFVVLNFLFKSESINICENFDCVINESNLNFENFVHSQNQTIVDYSGKEIKLRGVNLGGWLMWEGWIWGAGFDSQTKMLKRLEEATDKRSLDWFKKNVYKSFVTESDIEAISDLGFNVIRVPINHAFLEDPENWSILDNLIDWCKKYNVYIVLTLHSAPGGQANFFTADPDKILLWDSKENISQTLTLWKQISERYKEEKIIAGYDLINEPSAEDSQVVDLYKALVAVLRNNGDKHMIVIEGNNFAKDFNIFQSPISKNQTYSFHMYTWFGDDREKLLNRYTELSKKQNVPIWVGEFGENEYEMLESTVDMFENRNLAGWAFWTWKRLPNKYPALVEIESSGKWNIVANYIKSFFVLKKPTKQEMIEGMDYFLNTVRFENNRVNNKMLEILLPR